MAATKLWYPHYIRDFKAKTGHLSLAERGAYRALIDEYWENQGPLCADERKLCRMIGAFPDEWEEVREAVLAYFEVIDGKLVHARIDEEIEKAVSTHQAKKDRIAKARAAKEKKKPDAGSPVDSPVNSSVDSPDYNTVDRDLTGLNTGTPTPSPTPTPVTNVTLEPNSQSPPDDVVDHWPEKIWDKVYPHPANRGSRKKTLAALAKIPKGQRPKLLDGIKNYRAYLEIATWQRPQMLSTWLNAESWKTPIDLDQARRENHGRRRQKPPTREEKQQEILAGIARATGVNLEDDSAGSGENSVTLPDRFAVHS